MIYITTSLPECPPGSEFVHSNMDFLSKLQEAIAAWATTPVQATLTVRDFLFSIHDIQLPNGCVVSDRHHAIEDDDTVIVIGGSDIGIYGVAPFS
ncbi:MAG: hypothetical protein JWP09_239 [Candidatus Taylorbacteria bacterium]|nr:hypothetical protein [Candidatus Taylorbacteria bacterium]